MDMYLEATMLVCFGLAWPIANLRMIRQRKAYGSGPAFTAIILCGYVCGAMAKVLGMEPHGLAPVFWLYVFNATSVTVNVALQAWFGGHLGIRPGMVPARAV